MKNTTAIENEEKHVEKDARKIVVESTDNYEPETEKPLKVGNIFRFLEFKGIENYKVTDK